jgi:hypothetical protein
MAGASPAPSRVEASDLAGEVAEATLGLGDGARPRAGGIPRVYRPPKRAWSPPPPFSLAAPTGFEPVSPP